MALQAAADSTAFGVMATSQAAHGASAARRRKPTTFRLEPLSLDPQPAVQNKRESQIKRENQIKKENQIRKERAARLARRQQQDCEQSEHESHQREPDCLLREKIENEFEQKMKSEDFDGAVELMMQPWSLACQYLMNQEAEVERIRRRAEAEAKMKSIMKGGMQATGDSGTVRLASKRANAFGEATEQMQHSKMSAQEEFGVPRPGAENGQSDAVIPNTATHSRQKCEVRGPQFNEVVEDIHDGANNDSEAEPQDEKEEPQVVVRRKKQTNQTAQSFARVSRQVWVATPPTDIARLAKAGMQLTLALARLRKWEQVDGITEQVIDVLRGLSTATHGLRLTLQAKKLRPDVMSKGPPVGEEERWAQLMVRRGVACACMGPARFADAEAHICEVLRYMHKEQRAKRALKTIRFLREQLQPCGLPHNHQEEEELVFWTDRHASDGGPLVSISDSQRSSQMKLQLGMQLALEAMAMCAP